MCESKICSKCGVEKPINQFYTQKINKDGHVNSCKKCYNLQRLVHIKQFVYIEITEKQCNWCNITKSITEFHKNKRIKDGYNNMCKQCFNKYRRDKACSFIEPSKYVIEKRCHKCNTIKLVSEFHIDRYSTDGYSINCRDCDNARTRNRNVIYDNVIHDTSYTKRCYYCGKIKSYTEFFVNRKRKDGLTAICKKCSSIAGKLTRQNNPSINYRHQAKRRNFGFELINNIFNYSEGHHLHLENNHNFVIQIPCWLHRLYSHNSYTWRNMDSINAIALDFWINEDSIYKDLYEL